MSEVELRTNEGNARDKWKCLFCACLNEPGRLICSKCRVNRMFPENEDEPDGSDPRSEVKVESWSCEQCSFLNEENHRICEMCEGERRDHGHDLKVTEATVLHKSFTRHEEPPAEVPVSAGNETDMWSCPQCTFLNLMGRPSCEICGTDAPDQFQNLTDTDKLQQWNQRQKECEEQFLLREKERIEKNISEVKKIDDEDIVVPQKPFECPICFLDISVGDGVRLRGCLHDVCRGCLINSVMNEESGEIRCCVCHQEVVDRDIKNAVGDKLWEKRLQRVLRRGEANLRNTFHCLTVDCNGWAEIVDEVNDFTCPVCQKTNCLPCKAIHEGKTCQDHQNELRSKANDDDNEAKLTLQMFQDMIDNGEAMECPACEIFLQKKSGCDWMMCTMCKTEICWATKGRRWGPKGNGDTSGGCRCGIGGKCHPTCRFCH